MGYLRARRSSSTQMADGQLNSTNDHRFPKRVRLLRASEFEGVFAGRASAVDASISLYGAANELGYPRLGLVVSRRVGEAVVRNRWKRLLREAFRLSQQRLPALDLVCIARGGTPPPLHQLMEILPALAARIERQLQTTRGSTRNDE
jgi:ribonuclease P protein component